MCCCSLVSCPARLAQLKPNTYFLCTERFFHSKSFIKWCWCHFAYIQTLYSSFACLNSHLKIDFYQAGWCHWHFNPWNELARKTLKSLNYKSVTCTGFGLTLYFYWNLILIGGFKTRRIHEDTFSIPKHIVDILRLVHSVCVSEGFLFGGRIVKGVWCDVFPPIQ